MRIRDRIRHIAALVVLCGCAQVDVVAVPQPDAAHAPDARTPDARTDAQPLDADAADTGTQPLDSSVADAGGADAALPPPCAYGAPAGQAARTPFARAIDALSHAICSCDSIASSDVLTTDGAQDTLTGDVGVNGQLSLESTSTLDGSLSVAGGGGLHLGDNVELVVRGDLQVGGPLEGTLALARIAQDARVAGRIDLASLFVTGTLTQPAGSERRVSGTSELGALRSEDVVVAPPCDCAQASLFDTAAFVSDQAPLAMPLPEDAGAVTQRCAAYALPDGEVADLRIALGESAAVYVPGDLHVTGDLVIDSERGAEIDLFIAGDVRIDGTVRIGAADGQGPVRIYVGGSGTVQLSSGGALYGALYAPKAELVLSAGLTLRGALFMRRIAASAALTVHYDRSIR